jgi:acyl phosphate:glycerol-3-phosphate acyltransferase
MVFVVSIILVIISYLAGSIPFGLLIVKLKTGLDIRNVESGRTGGTNAMRAAGFWVGIFTIILDSMKTACMVWVARWLAPGNIWMEVISPVMAVIGHNYSIFLLEPKTSGGFRLRGGAGGAATVGGALGLYPFSIIIILPITLLIWFGIGYASLATMSSAILSIILFSILSKLGVCPWQYIFYGVFTLLILLWALRPNIHRLINGTERLIGWRARHKKNQRTRNTTK